MAVKLIGGPGLKVLDVGCSDGAISELIHKNGNECWGMDLPLVVARVPPERREWLKCLSVDCGVKPWRSQVGENDLVPDEAFDVVFAGEIIEHFIDLDPFMTESFRVLKHGGRFVLTTPNVAREINRLALIAGNVHLWHEWQRIPHHVRYFTPTTLMRCLTHYGFSVKRWGYGRSQAEIGGYVEMTKWLTPQERLVLRKLFDRMTPGEVWKHSFIVVEATKP